MFPKCVVTTWNEANTRRRGELLFLNSVGGAICIDLKQISRGEIFDMRTVLSKQALAQITGNASLSNLTLDAIHIGKHRVMPM